MKFSKRIFYIILFSVLYFITAFSSFWHAVEFFELSNVWWMGIILALAFEIGQAAVLLSILTSNKERSKFTPWLLMSILTIVQIIGNVYSSYKYIMINSPENLKYFKEPIFIWTDLPDAEATVIITYISSAILPLTALLLTSMITNYLSDNEETNESSSKTSKENEFTSEKQHAESSYVVKNTDERSEIIIGNGEGKRDETESGEQSESDDSRATSTTDTTIEDKGESDEEDSKVHEVKEELNETKETEQTDIKDEQVIENKVNEKKLDEPIQEKKLENSHFINL